MDDESPVATGLDLGGEFTRRRVRLQGEHGPGAGISQDQPVRVLVVR